MSREPLVSVIIPVQNEQQTIGRIIREAKRIALHTEVIVIVNGAQDRSAQIARQHGAIVHRIATALGHDVGRGIGAQFARGRILLFIDGDMIVPAKLLRHYVQLINKGADVALNPYSGPVLREQVHPVILAKHTLNAMLLRPDLAGASLTAVPHAMSRYACDVIGVKHLAVPPLAHTIALLSGLKIQTACYVNVGKLNRRRVRKGSLDSLQSLVIGDHLEALHWLISQKGLRGGLTDHYRRRELVK